MLIPDHETAVDFLNYEAISKTIVELIKDNRQRALTIGIHGDWGAGKSGVLRMVERQREFSRLAPAMRSGKNEVAKKVVVSGTL